MDDPGRWIDRHIQSFSQIPTYVCIFICSVLSRKRNSKWQKKDLIIRQCTKENCILKAFTKIFILGLKKRNFMIRKTPDEFYQTVASYKYYRSRFLFLLLWLLHDASHLPNVTFYICILNTRILNNFAQHLSLCWHNFQLSPLFINKLRE